MTNRVLILAVAMSCVASAVLAQAQETMLLPPKVLVITREVVKPGKGAAHQKWEAGYPAALAKAHWPVPYIGMTALTGEPRALYLTGYDSMAAWEADTQATDKNAALSAQMDVLSTKDGDFLSEYRTGVFTYLPELSYHADTIPVAGLRYFRIYTLHIKPGHGSHFTEVRKTILAAHQKAGLSDQYAIFHILAGGPSDTYLIFVPMKSLAEQDEYDTIHGAAYKQALGADGQKSLDDFQAQGVESSETNIFKFIPQMSYPRKEWMAADKFWASQAASMSKIPAKAIAKKEAVKQ